MPNSPPPTQLRTVWYLFLEKGPTQSPRGGRGAARRVNHNSLVGCALTLHIPIVINAVSTRVLLQFFSLSLPFALFVFHLVKFCTHHLACYEYKGTHTMPKTWNGQGENNCSKGQTAGKKELQAYNSSAYCINNDGRMEC
jgi:hypothetical protein